MTQYPNVSINRESAGCKSENGNGQKIGKEMEKVSELDRGIEMRMRKKGERYYTWLLAPSESI